MSIQYHDQPATVDVNTTETTVTVVSGIGAIGPQGPTGPEGPQGPPGAIASLTVSSPLASTGGSSPNLSLGVVPVTFGGTGVGSLTGYVYGNGTSAFTAATTIPNSAVSGLGTMALQNATSIAVTGGYVANVSEEVNCTNRTGSPIAIGKAVYIVGAHGDVPEIALADASGESTAARTLGITAEAIANSGTGRVCFSGLLKGINTNSLTEGALVWLSETAGELTTTRPTQPAHGVFMGLSVKQAPGGAGILFVSVVNGQELDELHDVLITSPTAGQLFKRNTGNTLWVNASPASLTATSDTNVTLTLGGNASTALVNDASLTLGWTGTLAGTRLNTNVVQSVSNDTNVTGSINSQALTLGWTGVLAGTRLNSAVVQSVSSDTNVTGSINSQAMTLGWTGQLAVGRGGTGASSLSGYLVGNGGSAFTAVSSIPGSAISGNISGNAANVTGTVAVGNGGTGATSLTGYLVGNGTSAFTAVSSIPNTAISGLGTMSTQNANNVAITGGSATSLALVTVAAGTVGSPSIAAQNDTATGLYWPSSATVGLVTNGTERLRLTSSGDTAIPATAKLYLDGVAGTGDTYFTQSLANRISMVVGGAERLRVDGGSDVVGTRVSVLGASSNPYPFLVTNLDSTAAALQFFDNGSGLFFIGNDSYNGAALSGTAYARAIWGRGAYPMVFGTNNVERLRITSGGNVAVAAAAKLYVDGVAATGDTYLHESSANNLSFVTGGTERVRIDGSGNVGVAATTFGSSAANVFAVKNGTEPTSGPADTVQIYSVDRSAGNTIPAIYCEGTGVTDAGITSTTVTHKIAMKVNGTVYYLLATTNAT